MNDKRNDYSAMRILDSLEWDIEPERDLWPDIHSNIRFAGKPQLEHDEEVQPLSAQPNVHPRTRTIRWAPISMAACMMLALGAFIMSTMSYQRTQQTYAMQESFIEFQKSQIGLIEQQHQHVRAQFVALLDGELGAIDPTTVAEVRAVLLTIDEASLELKKAILAQPLNKNYSTMLARTYQEELKLLNKFKAKNGMSI